MNTNKSKNFFRVAAEDFKNIPGSPIAYWLSGNAITIFAQATPLSMIAEVCHGLSTGKNEAVVRRWHEVVGQDIGFGFTQRSDALKSGKKWFPYNKGGEFRCWYGNAEYVLRYDNYGNALMSSFSGHRHDGKSHYFQEGVTWTFISSSAFAARYTPPGYVFDVSGSSIFVRRPHLLVAFLCSKLCYKLLKALNPTINFQVGNLKALPIFSDKIEKIAHEIETIAIQIIDFARLDWDSYETSWDFQANPLIDAQKRCEKIGKIHSAYLQLREEWRRSCEEMRRLEVENNRIFIEAYGLQDELSPEVPWNEITLTCNPWYRYGKSPKTVCRDGEELLESTSDMPISDNWEIEHGGRIIVMPPVVRMKSRSMPFNQDLETRLLADTVKEFISYAVGCMMGRYSPEKPGLILANQSFGPNEDASIYETTVTGEHLFSSDLSANVSYEVQAGQQHLKSSYSSFYPEIGDDKHFIMDRDGVLPILDEEWFYDDIVTQFKAFTALVFGEENLTANLGFIENVLGKDIRKYFVKDFYKDHVQRYRKRPIYWLFSSPKGSFNALIYLHRYTPDTVSIVLNEYLRELMTKIRTRIEHLERENNRADLGNAEKARNLKKIDKYTAQLTELEDYERDILFPLAQQKIVIDLDDGVKVNYIKFGPALKKISGLEAKEE